MCVHLSLARSKEVFASLEKPCTALLIYGGEKARKLAEGKSSAFKARNGKAFVDSF